MAGIEALTQQDVRIIKANGESLPLIEPGGANQDAVKRPFSPPFTCQYRRPSVQIVSMTSFILLENPIVKKAYFL